MNEISSEPQVLPTTKRKSPPRTPAIRTRLSPIDYMKFDQLCRVEGKTATEIVRQALLEYLDRKEKGLKAEYDGILEKRLKKMEDRIAGLLVKTAIDVGMIYLLMYRNMDLKDRDKAVAWAYNQAAQRLRKKLSDPAMELKEQVKSGD